MWNYLSIYQPIAKLALDGPQCPYTVHAMCRRRFYVVVVYRLMLPCNRHVPLDVSILPSFQIAVCDRSQVERVYFVGEASFKMKLDLYFRTWCIRAVAARYSHVSRPKPRFICSGRSRALSPHIWAETVVNIHLIRPTLW